MKYTLILTCKINFWKYPYKKKKKLQGIKFQRIVVIYVLKRY